MTSSFHSIKVKEIIRETPDAATVVFDIPDHLKETFRYLPGQYLTLKLHVDGVEIRRAYSFCTSPFTDQAPAITVKKVADGRASRYINDTLQAGQHLELMPPLGKFTPELHPANRKHYLLYAGGSGITPIMSILKSVLDREPESKISLVYANRDEQSIIFHSELQALQSSQPSRLHVFHCLENPAPLAKFVGRPGVEDYQAITREIQDTGYPAEYFICGPSGMMETVKNALAGLSIPAGSIHTEYFTLPASDPKPEETAPEGFSGETSATILYNGREFHITVAEGQTVLEAAQEQDVDPPYACQMGVCTTCRAKMLEGAVRMDEREGLSDSEIDAGYVLTCQSHPLTPQIKLMYE